MVPSSDDADLEVELGLVRETDGSIIFTFDRRRGLISTKDPHWAEADRRIVNAPRDLVQLPSGAPLPIKLPMPRASVERYVRAFEERLAREREHWHT